MRKPKHQLQETATYASDPRKVKKTLPCCVEQFTAFLMKSLFKLVTLRPSGFFWQKTHLVRQISV